MKTPEINWPEGIHAVIGADPKVVARSLADQVAKALKEALVLRPRASLALSGGTTPMPFFEALSAKVLDWGRVDVVLVDERWVDEDNKDSNTRLLNQYFFRGPAGNARFIPLKQPAESAKAGQPLAEEAASGMSWPLDVLVLGMGNDGHTASLFPDAPELATALSTTAQRTMAMTPPSQPQERISLTCKAMEGAGFTALHLRGEKKLQTLREAFDNLDEVHLMPVRAFLKPGLKVFWSP